MLLGCAIAVGGALAGFEAYVLKFALVVYVLLVGPLFAAAAFRKRTSPPRHRSFWPSSPFYMEGRRVKRRLRWITYPTYLIALAVALLTAGVVLFATPRMHQVPGGALGRLLSVLWEVLSTLGSVLVAYCLMLLLLKILFVRLGWMTREEAKPFPWDMPMDGWPESWLEPIDEQESTKHPNAK